MHTQAKTKGECDTNNHIYSKFYFYLNLVKATIKVTRLK